MSGGRPLVTDSDPSVVVPEGWGARLGPFITGARIVATMAEHGVVVSPATVSRILSGRQRTTRASVALAMANAIKAIRAELAESAGSDSLAPTPSESAGRET